MNRLSKFTIGTLFFYLISCQGLGDKYIDLSNDYWYKDIGSHHRTIESKRINYRNKIYTEVIDYTFNEDFIIAEQRPNSNKSILSLGNDLLKRFEAYKLYKRDSTILNDSFYSKLKGVVEKDSLIYNHFLANGATNDESKNLAIGIQIGEHLIENDPYYHRIFNSKINYWIICNSLDSLIGPLTKLEYITQKETFGIPTTLKLKFEN